MSEVATRAAQSGASSAFSPETVSPFLHDRGTFLHNPVSRSSLGKSSDAYQTLEHLRAACFLVEEVKVEARRTHLLYVSLERCNSCNHRCPFCPVSVSPPERKVMSQEPFESIAEARLRRWTYGVDEAPADFLCRRCEFALGE